ncbi:hypothetical protein BCV70DRAFT_173605 [Testicularia cyperi]|uniref:Uncharacterized protein n=1 Tax=Testicularia cyperi TaxID=1882483 RepID=A0A317XSP3_9BASI|nr:hypothetical protein BCV70DRAFT_173605 [Testicularia cyperi]
MHPSIANLSSRLHLCSGEVPPPLVGASATLVEPSQHVSSKGAYLYLFGGRLVSSRRMVNTLYRLDLDEMRWHKLMPTTKLANESGSGSSVESAAGSLRQPQPRYFHSADLWRDKIVFFGGMGYSSSEADTQSGQEPGTRTEELCVLDEVLAFDLSTQMWDYGFDTSATVSNAAGSASTSTSASGSPELAGRDVQRPAPRYAHLSSLSGDVLTIIGGQNLANQYVESVNLYSLSLRRWIGSQRYRKQCGSYRSLSVGARYLYKDGEKAKCYPRGRDPLHGTETTNAAAAPAPATGTGLGEAAATNSSSPSSATQLERVQQNPLPMSTLPSARTPLPMYLYSNYNFTDVRRELEVLEVRSEGASDAAEAAAEARRLRSVSNASQESALDVEMPLSPTQAAGTSKQQGPFVNIEDRSGAMGGVTLPPGLRFPTGALLGPYLLISGTYLANATQTFSIWALHLPTMVWSRIESGSALSTGSWNRAILWPGKNRLVVVGHKERDLVSDYNHRQTNWDHVVVLELEAWGIYQPPVSLLSEPAVQLGLDKLAASAPSALASVQTSSSTYRADAAGGAAGADGLGIASGDDALPSSVNSNLPLGGRGDFEIVCSDGLRIGCDRAILESRWPWFRNKMEEFRRRARRTLRIGFPAATDQFNLGMIPEDIADILEDEELLDEPIDPLMTANASAAVDATGKQKLRDPRFQPRHLQISEPSPVVLAFLQYVYTLRIGTALQRHPAVVCALMVLAKTYEMGDLAAWARHAAHVALADDLNPKTAAAGSRLSATLSPSASSSSNAFEITNADGPGLDLFRPAESLGLHPEERHRLAVCLYEAASLCGSEGLQIRALRVVMAIARWLQKHGAGPTSGGGGSAGVDRASNGRGDGLSRGSVGPNAGMGGGATSNAASFGAGAPAGTGVGSAMRSTSSTVSGRNNTNLLQMPSPAPSFMSRAGSDSASSQGPLTPNSAYHSFLDRRNDSVPSLDSGSALAYLNDTDNVYDSDADGDVTAGRFPRPPGSSQSKAEKLLGFSLQSLSQGHGNGIHAAVSVLPDERSTERPVSRASAVRKRFSLFGRQSGASEVTETAVSSDSPRAGTAVGFENLSIDDASSGSRTQDSSNRSLPSSRGADYLHSPLSSPVTEETTGEGYKVAQSIYGRPYFQTYHSHQLGHSTSLQPSASTSAASSPAIEQFPVNSYGPTLEQNSRSGSMHSLASSLSVSQSSLQRSHSSSSQHANTAAAQAPAAPTVGIEFSQDLSHLSTKEIAKLEKEAKKRQEKEEKERKKAEKAEYKRLAAEAVFGPKGSAGPTSAGSSDFLAFSNGLSPRLSSDPSDSRSGSGASTASPRTASIRTSYSPRSPATTAPTKRGEWSVTTATTASPWFSAPPPMMMVPGPKMGSKSNRSASSLSGKSSGKSRMAP